MEILFNKKHMLTKTEVPLRTLNQIKETSCVGGKKGEIQHFLLKDESHQDRIYFKAF